MRITLAIGGGVILYRNTPPDVGGDSGHYGWEAMFKLDGEFISRGGFATRAQAIQRATDEHAAQHAATLWSA